MSNNKIPQISASVKSFKELLNGYNYLRIPRYQRPYCWGKEELGQLWEDLFGEDSTDSGFWLLGNVVFCGTETRHNQIIDGQQRVTTLTIIAAALRDICLQAHAAGSPDLWRAGEVINNSIIAVTDDNSFTTKDLRLETGKERGWFEERIQFFPESSAPDTWEQSGYAPPTRPISNKIPEERRALWKAYLFFHGEIKKEIGGATGEALQKKALAIFKRIYSDIKFVVTYVPDDESAYLLFETLNERGLALSVSDLFKNLILSEAAKHEILETVATDWDRVVNNLDYSLIPQFLRCLRMMDSGDKITHRSLFKSCKKEISSNHQTKAKLKKYVRDIALGSERYAEILLKKGGLPSDLERHLHIFLQFGYSTTHPILLAGWQVSKDTSERKLLITLMEEFMLKYSSLSGQVTNVLEKKFPRIAKRILDDNKIDFEHIKAVLNRTLEEDADGKIWSSWSTVSPRINVAKGIFMRLEEHMLGLEELTFGASTDVHIEHVFPQSLNKKWLSAMSLGDKDEAGKYVGKIGNLCLLGGTKNKQASDKLFADKKELYAESDLQIPQQLSCIDNWSTEEIEAQSNKYLVNAKIIWNNLFSD